MIFYPSQNYNFNYCHFKEFKTAAANSEKQQNKQA